MMEDGDLKSSPETTVADVDVVRRARQALWDSTTYMQSNYRAQWEKNQSNFQSRHPSGSKYHSPAYRHRAKGFRPKTRAAIRRLEAACTNAFFGTRNQVDISAENDADKAQQASAALIQEALEYRMEKTMQWNVTLLGALQDTTVHGICISHQFWDYDEAKGVDTVKSNGVPVENVRFSPAADWRDVINTTPYLIHVMDMPADDVRKQVKAGKWKFASEEDYQAATKLFQTSDDHDSTRLARHDGRSDPNEADKSVDDYRRVYVYKYIMEIDGVDYQFHMLGQTHLLDDPVPMTEVTPGGFRNYTLGFSILEAHKTVPTALVQLLEDRQETANDLENSRLDNIWLALHKRWLVKRHKNIDQAALVRNVPGGAILTDDPVGDIREVPTSDVTSAAFKHQDYLTADFDEIAGTFSQSSVATNRRLGETATGMELLTGDSNLMTEYLLTLFAWTWVEPTVRQLVKFIQAYENDNVVLAMAAEKAKLFQKFGIDRITDQLLSKELTVRVKVGNDSTNPVRKVERLMVPVRIAGELGEPLDSEEVLKEVFGNMGYDDGARFIIPKDQRQPPQTDPNIELEQSKLELDATRLSVDQERMVLEQQKFQAKLNLDREIALAKLALEEQLTLTELEAKLGIEAGKHQIEAEKLETQREMKVIDTHAREREHAANLANQSMEKIANAG